MAKKRRRTGNRTRPHPNAQGAVGTAERPGEEPRARAGTDAEPGSRSPSSPRGGGPRRTRAEKKELARRQRDEIRRRIKRVQRARRLVWITGIAAVLSLASLLLLDRNQELTPPGQLPGLLKTQDVPWPANSALVLDRAGDRGLPGAGSALHIHANVQLFVHGTQEEVPQGIGINGNDDASIHTHTADGVVHIESDTQRDFTLGDFFDVWGVRLSSTCLGGFCDQGADHVQVFVDGTEVTTSIRGVVLDDQSVVVVTFGTADELPSPIPSTFDFGSITP